MLKTYPLRLVRLILGLLLHGFGSYLIIQANIGLGPWEALSKGISQTTGVSFGFATVATSVVILIIDLLLKERIGFGTLLNAILIGLFTDMFIAWNPVPEMPSFIAGLGLLLIAQLAISIGCVFYIGAALGCGPRDSLMVALGKRLNRVPVGAVRAGIEIVAVLVGWALGAKVGLGTVVSVVGLGFILQLTFKIFRFDVKGIRHESFLDTIRALRVGKKKEELK